MNWYGNRHNEKYIFKRVSWDNWQEHNEYNYITTGSIEKSADTDLKVTGSFDFEGYDTPDPNDLVRVYYSFTDDQGEEAIEVLATLFVSYASVKYTDTLKGIKAEGTLDGSSVLSVLQEKVIGMPKTIAKSANAVYEAEQLILECGLRVEATPSSYSMSEYHTFDAGTSYLEMVNWLLETASYTQAYPDAYGVVQLKSYTEAQERTDYTIYKNDEQSIMYPEIEASNDWQTTPNVVRLIYNTDEACIVASASNIAGSRASLSNRGNREITYFEELSEINAVDSRANTLKELAEEKLKEKSCDIEYVNLSMAFTPLDVYDPVRIIYDEMEWKGNIDVMNISLSPATKTQLKVKRKLINEIEITSYATVYREDV